MNEFTAVLGGTLALAPVLMSWPQGAIAAVPRGASHDLGGADYLIAQSVASDRGVQSGSAHTLVTTDGDYTQIEGGVQSGGNLFHRFDGFGIGVGETADFAVPEATQAVFGQVAGGEASYIDGRLQVSGSDADLYLVNPAGVLFGPEAQLNLGGSLTVTTADQVGFGEAWLDAIETTDYRNFSGSPDAYRFVADAPGAIVNRADLAVDAGKAIRFVGGDVVNAGGLRAAGGEVTLSAVTGDSVVRLGSRGGLLSVEVEANEVSVLESRAALNPLSIPELITGASPTADSLKVGEDGLVSLVADTQADIGVEQPGAGGLVLSAGEVDVSGQIGGEINLLGTDISVVDGYLEASGDYAGGVVRVGGDYQGKGPLPTARRVSFGEGAIASADSLVDGDGGQVVLWSDGTTQFDGQLSASGAGAGAGGLVETSGLRWLGLGDRATVSTAAESGKLGTWLLDPDDLQIVSTPGDASIVGGTNAPGVASQLNAAVLANALDGNNVELQANNSITVDAVVDASGNPFAGTLELNAPTLNLNERILLPIYTFLLPGTATTVNVGENGSVQNAVDAVADGGTVNLAAATYREASDIVVRRDVTLRGKGRDLTTLDGGGTHRVLTLLGRRIPDPAFDVNVIVDGLAIKNGFSGDGGGLGVFDGVNLSLENSLVENNQSVTLNPRGGGLFFGDAGSSVISNTIINNNFADGNGGGLVVLDSHQLSIENSTFSNNHANNNGGAIDSNTGAATIRAVDSRFVGNTSLGDGGAISLNAASLIVDGTEFEGNVADGWGGAINVHSNEIVPTYVGLTDTTFVDNRSVFGKGGAISTVGDLSIEEGYFEGNQATEGGAISFQSETSLLPNGSTFYGTSLVDRSTFRGNHATSTGGAIRLNGFHDLVLSNSTLYENTAQEDGGAVRITGNRPGRSTFVNSTFTRNIADDDGAGNGDGIGDGGAFSISSNSFVTLDRLTIANNTASEHSGGIAIGAGRDPSIGRSLVVGNTVVDSNGIVVSEQDLFGDFASDGYNLVQNRGNSTGYAVSDLPDLTDPLLGPLNNNGGGLLTMALLPGSPAIDAASILAPGETDQRGGTVNGLKDVGAYERLPIDSLQFVSGGGQSATVGTEYSSTLDVRAVDSLGGGLAGLNVALDLSSSGASGILDLANSTEITDETGLASFVLAANQVAGSYTLSAGANNLVDSTTLTNLADVVSRFALSGPTSNLVAGQQVAFSIHALDRFDNVADGYSSTVSFSSSDVQALLPKNSTLTGGVGSFEATPITAGVHTLSITDVADSSLTTGAGNIRVISAAPEVLSVVAGRGQTATVSSAFAEGLTVRVSDRFGNPVVGEAVTFSVPNVGAGGVLSNTSVLTDAEGLASATVQANDVVGRYDVIASAIGMSALFGLENEADAAPVPTVDPVTVDPVVADSNPSDLQPIDSIDSTDLTNSTDIASMPTVDSMLVKLIPGLSDRVIPPEGTTEVESSRDLLSEGKSETEQSLSSRSNVFDEVAFAETERLLTEEYAKYWHLPAGKVSTLESVQKVLQRAETHHKSKSAVVYALFVPPGRHDYSEHHPSILSQRLLRNEVQQDEDRLLLVMVPPEGQPVQQLIDVSRRDVVRQAQLLGIELSLVEEEGYQPLARQLYDWLLAPVEADLQHKDIDNLMYVMDEGLRTVPLAAMMTGDRFAIEQYGISMLPSVGLLNADFDTEPSEQNVLTAGADQFETMEALPAVPVELGIVGSTSTSAETLLNEAFNLEDLTKARTERPKTMMHLATHAAFNPGALDRSYVQLWDEQLTLNNISNLDLSELEMLILSACSTAVGSREAELGFAGLAAATGVESSMGSLWNVSDLGTMALMAEFYEQLQTDPLRFSALQNAQLSLLEEETRLEDGKLITRTDEHILPDGFVGEETVTFSHPFFWSAFTLIGSPWW